MKKIELDLSNLQDVFPDDFTSAQKAEAQTLFLKKLSEDSHRFYGGKMQTVPKAGVYGFNWFNVWYTPGVSKVSTMLRDNPLEAYNMSNKGNLVAVVSDSTRVLGDGDCGVYGGLGVMEGKAFLMKYLGGVDAVALCINNRDKNGKPDPDKIIDFVKMIEPSFGAVNLEDISQPNCYKVLDELRDSCNIPVWHDDAQGTASVTLAGLINALKLANKKIDEVKTVMLGAGAANSTIAKILIKAGMPGENIIMFDKDGALSRDRVDFERDSLSYRQWELCMATNPKKVKNIEVAMKGADVLIAVSKPGPDTVKPEWIKLMNKKAIVFTCANPVPEIYPYAAKEAGAFITATGRGDFSNQVNNSLGFPGILKGALSVRAKKITDNMAIRSAYSLAEFAEKRGITPDNIIPKMSEAEVFPKEAADVAMQAIADGVANINLTYDEVFQKAKADIEDARGLMKLMMDNDHIKNPPKALLEDALKWSINKLK
ncbi:MAG: malate dehydrogenase [Candidatus Cloacimonetes bacterium 4572_65]|nr:MAG: malate dehydrogenase [Candidatus Cloacimonetes bacterium 4572_65]